MAALGQTISGVAHELNNPLATILSWAERLAERSVDDKTRQGLEVILAESERAARIVRNLLTFARKRQTTRAMVDLNQVVRETLALRAYEQKVSNVQVVEALSSGLPEVFADGHQIKQVLLNLVINAEQACIGANGRGTIVVRTSHDADRGSAVLEVNDDGPGIAEDKHGRVFDPFFTTNEVGQGTGLGLATCAVIVKNCNGVITFESEPGRGTAFNVFLPRVEPPVVDFFLEHEQQVVTGRERILIVEDDEAIRQITFAILDSLGYRVTVVPGSIEALSLFRSDSSLSFDLLLTDVIMPEMDGLELARCIHDKHLPGLRTLFMSGYLGDAETVQAVADYDLPFLEKPFTLDGLARKVREALDAPPAVPPPSR